MKRAAERLYEELNDLRGIGLGEVLAKIETCYKRANSLLAQARLDELESEYILYIRAREGL